MHPKVALGVRIFDAGLHMFNDAALYFGTVQSCVVQGPLPTDARGNAQFVPVDHPARACESLSG